jgi:serine/threonine protein kinase
MAPEQWGGTPATPACDIYAATATFFECLTGAPPYPGAAGNAALKLQHLNAPIPVHQVPAPLRGLVRRGLAKQAQQRPANATAFLAELEAAARSAFGDAWETSGRQKLARGVALLSLLLPSAGGASAASPPRRVPRRPCHCRANGQVEASLAEPAALRRRDRPEPVRLRDGGPRAAPYRDWRRCQHCFSGLGRSPQPGRRIVRRN